MGWINREHFVVGMESRVVWVALLLLVNTGCWWHRSLAHSEAAADYAPPVSDNEVPVVPSWNLDLVWQAEALRSAVSRLRSRSEVPRAELVFLLDASASVGVDNFQAELRFVRRILADFTVSPDAVRVAVVAFSSQNMVRRHVDQLATPGLKCQLLQTQLQEVLYTGGGTYTLGALLEAQLILERSRPDADRVIFLVTDGYSNAGDPVPKALDLRRNGVEIFTFGIRNGNVAELLAMSSQPLSEHTFLLDSFHRFEALARRALHQDLPSGDFVAQNRSACQDLCPSQDDCCDEKATCVCGTHSGLFSCSCPPGHFGSGMRGDCHPCPPGTFREDEGPADESSCKNCPDPYQLSPSGAVTANECYCSEGYVLKPTGCEAVKCPPLTLPRNGYFAHGDCTWDFPSVCTLRCKTGFKLIGSDVMVCSSDGTWIGNMPRCEAVPCPPLRAPQNGGMECGLNDDHRQECRFYCDPGYSLVGSHRYTCLPLGMWDGVPASCRPVLCPPLTLQSTLIAKPKRCTTTRLSYGTTCTLECLPGHQLQGVQKVKCSEHGFWSEDIDTVRCIDSMPPEIQCPVNVMADAAEDESWALVRWDLPKVQDDSGNIPSLRSIPSLTPPKRMPIGVTKITYISQDSFGNSANCSFDIIIADRQPPKMEDCISPPPFLSRDENVDLRWEEPSFWDNSDLVVDIQRYPPGNVFPYGVTNVTYVATDVFGNNSTCVIQVTLQEHACEQVPDPLHGYSNCSRLPDGLVCTLTCEDGYAFAIRPRPLYFCALESGWEHTLDVLPLPDCSVTVLPTSVAMGGELDLDSLSELCQQRELVEKLLEGARRQLKEKVRQACPDGLRCSVDLNDALENICHSRKRRAIDRGVNFMLTVEGAPEKVSDLLLRLSNEELKITVKGHRTSVGRLKMKTRVILSCPEGAVAVDNKCVKCPAGTYYSEGGSCKRCPRGSFQEKPGQSECQSCPEGTSTKKVGQKKEAACVVPCPTGHASKTGLSPCIPCPRGYVQTKEGQMHCTRSLDRTKRVENSILTIVSTTNDCFSSPCQGGGTCHPLKVGFVCTCPHNLSGDTCAEEVDFCSSSPCLRGGTCEPGQERGRSFHCLCPPDTTGIYCEVKVDACLSSPCPRGSTCITLPGGFFFCECSIGLSGSRCEVNDDDCLGASCFNGGSCVDGIGSYSCSCPRGFTGYYCEEKIRLCSRGACLHKGSCLDTNDTIGFRCECLNGFEGRRCEKRVQLCETDPCPKGSTCQEVAPAGSFKCWCPPAFSGHDCQIELSSNFTLVFPTPRVTSDSAVVKGGLRQDLTQLTLCLWIRSADKLHYGTPFSFATRYTDNALTLTDTNGLVFYVLGQRAVTDATANDDLWHHFCVLWNSNEGQWTLFRDGQKVSSGKDLASGGTITKKGIVVLGQDQDRLGGGFSTVEALVGGLAHINLWSHLFTPEEVYNLSMDCHPPFGNVLAWPDFLEGLRGRVKVEDDFLCGGCPNPPVPVQGIVEVENENARYDCVKGLQLDGNPVRKCLPGGRWEGEEPTCRRVSCGSPPPVPGGFSYGGGYLYGDIVKIQCHLGLTLEGAEERECQWNRTWSGRPAYCHNRTKCIFLKAPLHGQIIGDESEAEFTCLSGFQLEGDTTLKCLEDGSWDNNPPSCIPIYCAPIQPPVNGKLLIKNSDQISLEEYEKNGLPVGSSLKFSCADGLIFEGEEQLECLSNSSWSAERPNCSLPAISECPYPSAPSQGWVLVAGRQPGDEASYGCKEGFRVDGMSETICNKNGSWSLPPKCKAVQICDRPTGKNGAVIVGLTYKVGHRVLVSCPPGHHPVGSPFLTCNKKGIWEGGEAACTAVCTSPCLNGGKCIRPNLCACPAGFTGHVCEHPLCVLPCQNGGTCSNPFNCTCTEGYTGDVCETPICSHPCQNGGWCTAPDLCSCLEGFNPPYCTSG